MFDNRTKTGFKVLFIVPYPLKKSPSQRFRFEQYFQSLTDEGFTYEVQTFLDSQNWRLFFKPGQIVAKAIALTKGFIKRFSVVFTVFRYDYIFIHREATPVGPPVFEWIVSRILKKKVIYDFDDAIWATDRKNEPLFLRVVKWRSKVKKICSWSYRISCGNDYLAAYARNFNTNVVTLPTTIETKSLHNKYLHTNTQNNHRVVIGWTGSSSTLKYLHEIEHILARLKHKNDQLHFRVIADLRPSLEIDFEFIKWNMESEIEDLLALDIGIMPLPDDEWSKGKCGFKILQYMALEISAVASDVGVNGQIIDHGVSGFVARSSEDWDKYLTLLINNPDLRIEFGRRGRITVENRYSVAANEKIFLTLFER